MALDVPAFGVGIRRAGAVDDRVVVTDCSMTNGQLAVRWNKHGDLTSIIDIASQRELIPTGRAGRDPRTRAGPTGRVRRLGPRVLDPRTVPAVSGGVVTVDADGPLVGRVQRRGEPSVRRSW